MDPGMTIEPTPNVFVLLRGVSALLLGLLGSPSYSVRNFVRTDYPSIWPHCVAAVAASAIALLYAFSDDAITWIVPGRVVNIAVLLCIAWGLIGWAKPNEAIFAWVMIAAVSAALSVIGLVVLREEGEEPPAVA